MTDDHLLALAHTHLRRLTHAGLATGYGPDDSRMWMASLDTRTGRYPADDARPADIPSRCYRWIAAPRGCNLYWDLPQVVAAHALSALTGDRALSPAADAYVADFLDRCVAPNGVLLWGNHYYWDAFEGEMVRFTGGSPPAPCGMSAETGDLHEARPLPVAWEVLWRVSPDMTERAMRAMLRGHVFDAASGGFNRHADGRPGCAFLEAGGILVEAAAWLFERTGDEALLDTARSIADFSFRHRHPVTGLLENNPTQDRWDKFIATSEIGLWAGCLLRAAHRLPELEQMAAEGLGAWLRLGFDEVAGRWFGRLDVRDGRPVRGPKTTEYQPDEYADPWEPLFPAHDYPWQMAEACLELLRATQDAVFGEALERWIGQVQASLPPRGGRGAYAEHYGRAVHLLCGAAEALEREDCLRLARDLAAQAVDPLWADGLFRGHPGEERYDAVDGVGCLLLGLMRLATGADPPLMGFHF